ncbi:MAG: acyl-CoA/acyl-ACP dehydrogenase [Pseudomonadaceae bacterium]|nr:acyl-CoA/acyl-ACP dehydrogenase [Pseudomonadaceae bacterium]
MLLSEEQSSLVDNVSKLCSEFGDDYWRERDEKGGFPEAFYRAVAAGGWLGIAMPEKYGGAGLGITEASLLVNAVARSGAGMSGASAIHLNIFGLNPVIVFGTDEQCQRHLPPLIAGEEKACFAVTEPNAGLNTTALETLAEREGNEYLVNGQKLWTTTAQVADKFLLLARTTPLDKVKRSTEGLTLFYTDFDRSRIEVREIAKMGRKAIDSNAIFIDDLRIPEQDLIGEEGRGFEYILHGLNPERILIAAEAIGLGQVALDRASAYARDRVVFGRPIGQNQGIAHPLAKCWMELNAAWHTTMDAAMRYDMGLSCGSQANSAKYLGAEAGHHACETAVLTHGGMGYAKEYHVERWLRESYIPRIAPVSRELICCFIAERELGLPKSY